MHDTLLSGRCMCGAVRYRVRGPAMVVHCCHCTECQRQNGSAFAVNALIERSRIALVAGVTQATHMPAESGRGQTVHRCAACAVSLWSHYPDGGEAIAFLRVGTLDDPSALPPDVHIFTRSRLPWVVLPAAAVRFDAFYDPGTTWSEAVRVRYGAAIAAATGG